MWVKWTDCIVVGTGDYEEPLMKDVRTGESDFKDIENHWAKNEIMRMVSKGYANGNDGMFRPDDNITRAEFVSMAARVLGLDTSRTFNVTFKDVKSSDWFYGSVYAAAKNGMIKGYEDGSFKPNSPISRQEISYIMGNLLKESASEEEAEKILSQFSDEISDWAKVKVASVVKAEIIKGLPGNLFGGSQNATRAQAAVMFLRYLEN